MSRLRWYKPEDLIIEYGVDRGVLYFDNGDIESWSGLTVVTDRTTQENKNSYYLDSVKLKDNSMVDEFSLSIEAYTYPDKLNEFSVSGFSYRTFSNDSPKTHIVYNPKFLVKDRLYSSIGFEVETLPFSWDVDTTPIDISGFAPTSHIILNMSVLDSHFLEYIETKLYGNDDNIPEFPNPNDIIKFAEEVELVGTLIILDHGNGLWTAIGPDSMIEYVSPTEFSIDSPTLTYLNAVTYTVSSY